MVEFLDRIIPGTDAEIAKKFMTVRSLWSPLYSLVYCDLRLPPSFVCLSSYVCILVDHEKAGHQVQDGLESDRR